MPAITYGELFAYLGSLGFGEASRSAFDTVLEHPARGIVVIFALAASEDTVRGADLLSAETQLQHHGLLEGSIQGAILAARVQ